MNRRTQGILWLFLAGVGEVLLPFAIVAAAVAPAVSAFFRAFFAIPILAIIGILGTARQSKEIALQWPGKKILALLLLGVLHAAAFFTSANTTLRADPAVSTLFGQSAVWTIVISGIWFKEKITWRTWAGLVLSFLGICFVVMPLLSGRGYPLDAYLTGILTPLLAAIIWTLSGRERYLKHEYTAVSKSFYQNLIAAPILYFPFFLKGARFNSITPGDWFWLIILGAVLVPATFITKFAGQKLIPESEQQKFTLFNVWVKPAVLVGESIRQGGIIPWNMWVAMVFVLAGYLVAVLVPFRGQARMAVD